MCLTVPHVGGTHQRNTLVRNKCFVREHLMTETAQFFVTMDKLKDPETSWVKLTTITMISHFSTSFDTEFIKTRLTELGPVTLGKKPEGVYIPSVPLYLYTITKDPITGKKKRVRGEQYGTLNPFEWTLLQVSFYNQFALGYLDQFSKKSVKIFSNGGIHVTGCANAADCTRTLKQLETLLSSIIATPLEYEPPKVVMVNANFSINYNINLIEATRLFGASKRFTVEFNPDRYSAIKVQVRPYEGAKEIKLNIFSTGRTIITSAVNLKEIVMTYKIIMDFINSHGDKIKVNKSKSREVFDVVEGWNIIDVISHFKSQGVLPYESEF